MKLGEKIKFFREKLNLSPKQLADMIHVSEMVLNQYEKGEAMPDPEMLREISHSLRISPVYFFDTAEKALLVFPMNYEGFQKWCRTTQSRYTRPFLDKHYFEYTMKSDRYFIEINKRYLIRLNDGFYFIPIITKMHNGKHCEVLALEQMRKVLNEDILFLERELRKKNLFRLNPAIFSKEVYVSKYDHVDPIYLSDEEEMELFDIAAHCNHVVGYNERKQLFYLLETNGINQIPLAKDLPQGILNEKKIYLDVKSKKRLTTVDIKELIFYVFNEEAFIRRIEALLTLEVHSKQEPVVLSSSDVIYNLEALEKKEKLHETDYNSIAHFLRMRYWALDNIKRMLYLTHETQDSIFEDEWELYPYVDPKKKEELTETQAEKEFSILVVDDSVYMRSVLINILNRNFSCDIEEAKDGEEGFKKFELKKNLGQKYDLIILDITMPKVDGFTLLKQIMHVDKNATIVMCSSVTNKKIVLESIRHGAKHFITKPVDEKDMAEIVKKVLKQKKMG